MNTFGKNIIVTIFGESHSKEMGLTITGLPKGITIDQELMINNLKKRAGNSLISTTRREIDEPLITSGLENGLTNGLPLTIILKNQDFDDSVYQKGIIRPSHADLTYFNKYHGLKSTIGGGQSSGRMTALLVCIGSIAEQLLQKEHVKVLSYVKKSGNIITNDYSDQEKIAFIKAFTPLQFTFSETEPKMINLISETRLNHDSLGGEIETFVTNMPPNLGEPFFDSFESILSHLLFSIPGIKGVTFGEGEKFSSLKGSEQIDALRIDEDKITFLSNHQGGINGGITNGNYVKFSSICRAPGSITQTMQSIDVLKNENIDLNINGRHDPFFAHRALVVINAVTYWTILDLYMENKKLWQH